MTAIQLQQVNNNFNGNQDDDDPFKAGRAAGVGEAAEYVGHVQQGLGFVLDLKVALAEFEQTGNVV
jgi:hypothetical protein